MSANEDTGQLPRSDTDRKLCAMTSERPEEKYPCRSRLCFIFVVGILLVIMLLVGFLSYGDSVYHKSNEFLSSISDTNLRIPEIYSTALDNLNYGNITDTKYQSIAKRFCTYIHENPVEPDIVIYNRVPKTGSGNNVHLFRELAKKNNFSAWSIPAELRLNVTDNNIIYKDSGIRKTVVNTIYSKLMKSKGKRIIVDGHFSRIEFTSAEFLGKTIESINTLRDCGGWSISKLYWTMADSNKVKRIIRKGESTYKEYIHKITGMSVSFDECINDFNCLQKSELFRDQDQLTKYLCGDECIKLNSGLLNGALSNIDDPIMFTDIGILKYFTRNLEMLECVYPKLLNGISELYQNQDHTYNAQPSIHEKAKLPPSVLKWSEEYCDPSVNIYSGSVYLHAINVFLAKYEVMKNNRAICCRH